MTCDYLYSFDLFVEEIDYDEENEEILDIRRAFGTWATDTYIEDIKPSQQVKRFLEKTGLKYADIYGDKRNNQSDNKKTPFDIFPDLLAGAPGTFK